MKTERSTLDQVKARFAENKKKMQEKKQDYDLDERMRELKEEEERAKEYRRDRKQEKKRKVEEEEAQDDTDGMDPDMAAMMGFGGFGSSKKWSVVFLSFFLENIPYLHFFGISSFCFIVTM